MFKGKKQRYVRVVMKPSAWKRLPLKLLKWSRKFPTSRRYNLVQNDDYDPRIPLYPDAAFDYGISFPAKYIGTLDVPRPTSRVEIVAAMRRVRYEFKAKGVKKRKVTIHISTTGVRVSNRPPTRTFFFRRKKTKNDCAEIIQHPIYRIFYVSHDSADLKIFSYIARDGATNVFKCNVFKSNNKTQAMRIVRTVGQAFDVCHKLQTNAPDYSAPSTSSAADSRSQAHGSDAPKEAVSECGVSESTPSTSKGVQDKGTQNKPIFLEPPPRSERRRIQHQPAPNINLPDVPECVTKVELSSVLEGDANTPLSTQHHLKLLKERLEQQAQQTRAAVAQMMMLRDQLVVEQAARCEAQARTHQLLVHNKELLEHIAALVSNLQDKEKGIARPINSQQLTMLPQLNLDGGKEGLKTENASASNGNYPPFDEDLINLFSQNGNVTQNTENNNITKQVTPPPSTSRENGSTSSKIFDGMTNEEIQDYLIKKFDDINVTNNNDPDAMNHQFFQNSKAFPDIPPVISHFSEAELENELTQPIYIDGKLCNLAQAMSVSQDSLDSNSESSSHDASSDEGTSSEGNIQYIKPLSHKATLQATGNDGKVRIIVPVSPSESTSRVSYENKDEQKYEKEEEKADEYAVSLKVPVMEHLAPPALITRTSSEKVPNRSEMMATLRAQWTRHTTK